MERANLIVDYDIVREPNLTSLAAAVKGRINQCWQPFGHIVIADSGAICAQAIILTQQGKEEQARVIQRGAHEKP